MSSPWQGLVRRGNERCSCNAHLVLLDAHVYFSQPFHLSVLVKTQPFLSDILEGHCSKTQDMLQMETCSKQIFARNKYLPSFWMAAMPHYIPPGTLEWTNILGKVSRFLPS